MPALIIAIIAGGLVLAGIVPPSTMFYTGVFGAMLLMHLGGHGAHADHTDHTGQAGHTGDEPAVTAPDREGTTGARSRGCH